jgi:hypothetical protein
MAADYVNRFGVSAMGGSRVERAEVPALLWFDLPSTGAYDEPFDVLDLLLEMRPYGS